MRNLLPYDGEVYYLKDYLSRDESVNLFNSFSRDIKWKQDELMMFGKLIQTKRLTAWYSNSRRTYTYSGIKRESHPFTPELSALCDGLNNEFDLELNSCLLNYYHNGKEGMMWHKDNEAEICQSTGIASLSLGAERPFFFKHDRTKEKLEIQLDSGSLLLMQGEVQNYWKHALPVRTRVTEPRINLTFRKVISV